MELSETIEKMISENKQVPENYQNQLKMLEKVEQLLKKLGISLDAKFEIPLASRIGSFQREKNA